MAELNPIPPVAYQATSTHNADTFNPRGHLYNDPTGVRGKPVDSSIGPQAEKAFYIRKALVEAERERCFGKLADTQWMPKHSGQRMRAIHILPLLDDRNLNDQGIDARGAYIKNGNLYGSSKDIGRITSRLPLLTEIGGRVNRVGFQRTEIEGTFNRFGFFYEYSREFLDFDSDPQIKQRMYREAIVGAEKIAEDTLQIDLLNGAGTLVYSGGAVSDATMDKDSMVSYGTLQRLRMALDANRTPKSTKIIKGSANYDTRTVQSSRIMFVGSELIPLLEVLRDPFGKPAFVPVHKYAAAAGTTMMNEVGVICGFRVIQCEEMKHWSGQGGTVPNDGSADHLRASNGKFDIFPMLVVGSEAFTTIGFNGSNGINNKFKIEDMQPRVSRDDPYGNIGLVSIEWYYGIMFLRPERIGLIKTVAPL